MAVRMDTVASTYKGRDEQGLQHFVAEIYADEISDIKGKTVFGSVVADPNSTAYVVKAGKLYVMGGDSKWYDTDGTEVS
jgi:hypothetical protein